VSVAGGNKVSLKWPGKDLDYCGSKIKDRPCDKQSMDPKVAALFNAKFCFGPYPTCNDNKLLYI
jgi:hypothetical protein